MTKSVAKSGLAHDWPTIGPNSYFTEQESTVQCAHVCTVPTELHEHVRCDVDVCAHDADGRRTRTARLSRSRPPRDGTRWVERFSFLYK